MLKGSATVKFNSKLLLQFMDQKTANILVRIGGFLRKVAQRGMKIRVGPSKPGQPPNAHSPPLLRTFLEYAYDTVKKRLVVGPKLLPRSNNLVLPGLMERGGLIESKVRKKSVMKRYPARPFMKPALEAQSKNLLMNSLKGELQ